MRYNSWKEKKNLTCAIHHPHITGKEREREKARKWLNNKGKKWNYVIARLLVWWLDDVWMADYGQIINSRSILPLSSFIHLPKKKKILNWIAYIATIIDDNWQSKDLTFWLGLKAIHSFIHGLLLFKWKTIIMMMIIIIIVIVINTFNSIQEKEKRPKFTTIVRSFLSINE